MKRNLVSFVFLFLARSSLHCRSQSGSRSKDACRPETGDRKGRS